MKKTLLLFVSIVGIQSINAHTTGSAHLHETALQEWAWILLPSIVVLGLIWKFSRKGYSANKR